MICPNCTHSIDDHSPSAAGCMYKSIAHIDGWRRLKYCECTFSQEEVELNQDCLEQDCLEIQVP